MIKNKKSQKKKLDDSKKSVETKTNLIKRNKRKINKFYNRIVIKMW